MNNVLRDSAGVMLGVGDSVQLSGKVSAVYPGEPLNTQVKVRVNGGEITVLIPSSHLTRTGTLLGDSAKAIVHDVAEMRSGGEIPIRKDTGP